MARGQGETKAAVTDPRQLMYARRRGAAATPPATPVEQPDDKQRATARGGEALMFGARVAKAGPLRARDLLARTPEELAALELEPDERARLASEAAQLTNESNRSGSSILQAEALGMALLAPLAKDPRELPALRELAKEQAAKLALAVWRRFGPGVIDAESWRAICELRAERTDDKASAGLWRTLALRPDGTDPDQDQALADELYKLHDYDDGGAAQAGFVFAALRRGEDLPGALARSAQETLEEHRSSLGGEVDAILRIAATAVHPYGIAGRDTARYLEQIPSEWPEQVSGRDELRRAFEPALAGAVLLARLRDVFEASEWLNSAEPGVPIEETALAREIEQVALSRTPWKNKLESYGLDPATVAHDKRAGVGDELSRAGKLIEHAAAATGLSPRAAALAIARSTKGVREMKKLAKQITAGDSYPSDAYDELVSAAYAAMAERLAIRPYESRAANTH